ncbi:LysR substrate-binding domain-containing protein [Enterovirga aerilata]|uniref:LysR family transcriptional regulator n=1 Tax=Enterovirga aerilata TaxID=2730920 RepID=A0A849ILV6_9HYPH|nr:LysR substrate-binding domain-containing protein [Enterovirga sp. DB1703]NNM74933.1 LysR family transcriptional regulator [Enterovirga sp. DB1703]
MNIAALSLRDLEYVVAVSEERHFGRAAERCNVSQPSLSAQIRRLEEALGLTLFERTSRKVLPTARGEAVARQARAVLAEAQKLLVIAQEGRDALSGRLVLGAIQTLGPYLFPRVLRQMRQLFPDLALTLSEGRTAELLEALREGRLDAVLLSPPIDEMGLTVTPLFSEPFLLSCPADHPLARSPELRADALGGPELLLLEEGNCLRDQALAACAAGPHAGRHATSLETLRSMVAAGAGYTLMPRLAAPEGTDRTGLVVSRPFPEGGPARPIALVWRATDPRRASLEQFAAFFRENAPEGTIPLASQPGEQGS